MMLHRLKQLKMMTQTSRFHFNVSKAGLAAGYRSGLEEKIATQLTKAEVIFEYERVTFGYQKPAKQSRYTPDFVLPNGIIIESKGLFTVPDRQKHILMKQQCAGLELRFVFSRSKSRISKTSMTTYAAWCAKNGFLFADKLIPQGWLDEPTNPDWHDAIEMFKKR